MKNPYLDAMTIKEFALRLKIYKLMAYKSRYYNNVALEIAKKILRNKD